MMVDTCFPVSLEIEVPLKIANRFQSIEVYSISGINKKYPVVERCESSGGWGWEDLLILHTVKIY